MMAQPHYPDEIVVREAIPSSEAVRERFGAIDGLHALAILAILAYEIVRFAPSIVARNGFVAEAASDASQGFSLFLILSGFALAYPAIVAATEHGCAYLDIGRFIVKRVLRIYPAYALALVLAIALPTLALRYGLPALTGGAPAASLDGFWRNLIFTGDGLGNDGFRALGVVVRCYIAFPFLLLLWARARRFFSLALAVAIVLDLFTGLHGIGIGGLVPFALGIVAADVRAQGLPAYRFGIPLALLAGFGATRYGAELAHLADTHAAGALRIDPLWSIALFGVVVAVGALGWLERFFSLAPVRLLGVTSFSISLVAVPVTAFAIRQLAGPFGVATAAINALVASLIVGFVLYQFIDRTFAEGSLRRDVADRIGPFLNRALRRVRAARVLLGTPPPPVEAEIAHAHAEVEFYAPPPRPVGDLAIVSTRTGSAEDLAAEMIATKKRLSDRSDAFFSGATVALSTSAEPEKPGFYRKPKTLAAVAVTAMGAAGDADSDAVHGERSSMKMRINSIAGEARESAR